VTRSTAPRTSRGGQTGHDPQLLLAEGQVAAPRLRRQHPAHQLVPDERVGEVVEDAVIGAPRLRRLRPADDGEAAAELRLRELLAAEPRDDLRQAVEAGRQRLAGRRVDRCVAARRRGGRVNEVELHRGAGQRERDEDGEEGREPPEGGPPRPRRRRSGERRR
jgi:hypothetical protein